MLFGHQETLPKHSHHSLSQSIHFPENWHIWIKKGQLISRKFHVALKFTLVQLVYSTRLRLASCYIIPSFYLCSCGKQSCDSNISPLVECYLYCNVPYGTLSVTLSQFLFNDMQKGGLFQNIWIFWGGFPVPRGNLMINH